MLTFWQLVLIALAPSILVSLYKLLTFLFGLSGIYHTHADLAVAAIEQNKNYQVIKIKIAHSGSSPLIVKEIKFTSLLFLAHYKERFRAWFQLARGFLTDDFEGLQTVLGQNFTRKEPVWIRKVLNTFQGIILYLWILSTIYNPIGWILLLTAGPYNNLKIVSSDVITKEIQTNVNKVPPFLIKPSEETEFLINYNFLVKSKYFVSTEAKYVQEMPNNPLWKLPRPGNYVLQGKVKLLIKTTGFLSTYRINLGKKDFVLIPLQDN